MVASVDQARVGKVKTNLPAQPSRLQTLQAQVKDLELARDKLPWAERGPINAKLCKLNTELAPLAAKNSPSIGVDKQQVSEAIVSAERGGAFKAAEDQFLDVLNPYVAQKAAAGDQVAKDTLASLHSSLTTNPKLQELVSRKFLEAVLTQGEALSKLATDIDGRLHGDDGHEIGNHDGKLQRSEVLDFIKTTAALKFQATQQMASAKEPTARKQAEGEAAQQDLMMNFAKALLSAMPPEK